MRLVLCDDNRILCEALAVALEARGHQALAIAMTPEEGVAAVARHRPDACLMDVRFPYGGDGLDAARIIRDRYPDTTVVVMSGSSDPALVSEVTRIGMVGFLGKDQEFDKIAAALDEIAAGRRRRPIPGSPAESGLGPGPRRSENPIATLTPREAQVLRRIAEGQSTSKMAGEMNVTTETLRTYVRNVLAKLGARNRLEAATLASRHVPPPRSEPDRDHPSFAVLTRREREVLLLLTGGSGAHEVARQLHMSLSTVNTHMRNLRNKLGVHSTLEAVVLARSRFWPASAAELGDLTNVPLFPEKGKALWRGSSELSACSPAPA
jgi:two-component system, NarL family, nitrate/nitrite response regulator NarL